MDVGSARRDRTDPLVPVCVNEIALAVPKADRIVRKIIQPAFTNACHDVRCVAGITKDFIDLIVERAHGRTVSKR